MSTSFGKNHGGKPGIEILDWVGVGERSEDLNALEASIVETAEMLNLYSAGKQIEIITDVR